MCETAVIDDPCKGRMILKHSNSFYQKYICGRQCRRSILFLRTWKAGGRRKLPARILAWLSQALKPRRRTTASKRKSSLQVGGSLFVIWRLKIYLWGSWFFSGKVGSIVYTALNRMGQANYTTWPTGSAVAINGWGTGEPAQFNTENCGAFK